MLNNQQVLLASFVWLLYSAAALQIPPAGEQQELFPRSAAAPISKVLASLNRPSWPLAHQDAPSSSGGSPQQTDSKTISQQSAPPQQNELFQSFVDFEPSDDALSSLNVPLKPGPPSDSQQRQPSLSSNEVFQSSLHLQPGEKQSAPRGVEKQLGSFSSFVLTPSASHPVLPPGTQDLSASPYWADPDGRPAPDPPLVRVEDLVNTRSECGNGTVATCDPYERYRRLDGSCNNLDKPLYGSTNSVLQRLVHKHEDATMMRRVAKSGRLLPNPRSVGEAIRGARSLHTQRDTSLMLMVLGQFIDHDLVFVPVVEDLTNRGKELLCRECTSWLQHPSCAPVPVGLNDPVFQGAARPFCLPFTRSVGEGILGPDGKQYLENTNANTGYLDLSAVYGSDTCTGSRLRSYTAGQLLTAHTRNSPYGLPVLAPREVLPALCNTKSQLCHYAGDERPNENMALLTMHTVFVREHNHIATELGRLNPAWGDERLYQEARRYNVAQYQHIVVTELLPRLFGPRSTLLQKYGFALRPGPGPQQVYQPQVNGQVLQEFTTAAYRFGHTLVPDNLILSDERLLPMGSLKMAKLFNDPSVMQETMKGTMHDALVRGLLSTRVEGADLKVVDTLRDKLFVERGDPNTGQDLIARNLARGRDHGLAPYTSYRSPCALPPVRSWQQMSPLIPLEHVTRLQTVYEHWDDVDLFVGGLAEDIVDGGLLGPTFACIIALQFYLVKVGDRFWYDGGARGLSPTELASLRVSAVMSKLVARTLDNEASLVPPDAFRLPNIRSNRPVSAHSLRSMSLLPWRDPQALQPRLCLYHEKSYGMNEAVPVSPCLACRCSGDRYVHCDLRQLDCGVIDRYIPESSYDEYCYRMCPPPELDSRPRPYASQNLPLPFPPYH